jgi:hypothetical protein
MTAVTDRLVTVTAYPAGEDARKAQGALDSAGIESVVDEAVEQRAKVRVENVNAIRAGDVLTANVPTLTEIDEADEDPREQVCPECDARDVSPSRRAQTFALIAVLAVALGVGVGVVQAAVFGVAAAGVFLLIRGRWRCNLCGETFD